jgi:hypothetical protein
VKNREYWRYEMERESAIRLALRNDAIGGTLEAPERPDLAEWLTTPRDGSGRAALGGSQGSQVHARKGIYLSESGRERLVAAVTAQD